VSATWAEEGRKYKAVEPDQPAAGQARQVS
jgi:hypothetical protein